MRQKKRLFEVNLERRADMWKCRDCGSNFEFPEVKRPDAGLVSGVGILGLRKLNPVNFCPDCLSTKIELERKE